ncbi:MAG: HAMP domain-containing histidine kinase [Candidatus Delongbacteria bacterium]|nr:HAMP domain-containing histidine kinase [Candidatus Delongbacteria bacterium]
MFRIELNFEHLFLYGIVMPKYNKERLSFKSRYLRRLDSLDTILSLRNDLEILNKKLNTQFDDFAMAIHDLKNIASIITANTSLLKIKKELSKDDYQAYIDSIHISSAQLVKKLCSTMKILKLDEMEIAPSMEYVNLSQVILELINTYSTALSIKKQKIEVIGQINLFIYTDKKMFYTIMENLISNAIKFSPNEKRIQISVTKKDDLTSITLKDEGLGMTNSDLKSIFKRFSNLSASPTNDENSSGFGLYVVKKLCDLLKIDISVTSEGQNLGTVFNIFIK